MTRNAVLLNFEQNRVTITIKANLSNMLRVPARCTLHPVLMTTPREVRGLGRCQRPRDSFVIHPREHEHLSGVPLLDDHGYETGLITLQAVRNARIKAGHEVILPELAELLSMGHDGCMAGATTYAQAERAALCDLFVAVGPDAPTLCEGWTTKDLAVHLIIREGRIDAAPGILIKPLASHTEKVTREYTGREWPELISIIRSGPPKLSLFAIPGMDGLGNFFEYVVHHEDVRRAPPGWQPRTLPSEESDLLWERLCKARKMLFRSVKGGVILVRTDESHSGTQAMIGGGDDPVTLTGSALDLTLLAYGRHAVNVEIGGSDAAKAAFSAAKLGF